MLLLFIAAASVSANPITTCSTAMRGLGRAPATEILQACPAAPPKRVLWPAEARDDRCDPALNSARSFAKMAHGLPPAMIAGMLRSFDAEVAECTQPTQPPKPLPPTDCVHAARLWC